MMKISHVENEFLSLRHKLARPMSRDKADTLLLLIACALVLAPLATYFPKWIFLCSAAALLWRGWITFRGNRMPSRWLLLPIAGLGMGAVYWQYGKLLGKESGVAMLILLITFKLLEMHAKRDLFAVVFVSFFMILANFLYSQSIGTALMMIVAVIAILSAQLSFQYTGVVPPLKKRLGLGALIFSLAVPLTLVLFILFPRIQGPLWGMPGDSGSGRTGLSEEMKPGQISDLAQSSEVAFRVKFLDPPPHQSKLYWRGIVLGKYENGAWTKLQMRPQSGNTLLIRRSGMPIRQLVTLEPNGKRWLFALDLPQAAPNLDGNLTWIAPDMQMLASNLINQRIRYSVTSYVDFNLHPNETAEALQDWLTLPDNENPQTLAFAARLRAQSNNNTELLDTVFKFFRVQEFNYTLQPPKLGKDPIDQFLFSTRAGFCEHYASAFVVIMRALGIPARVVAGYQGGEINPVDGFMIVRQSDAHAWAEVWLENRGWVRVDPTAAVAPDRISINLDQALPRTAFGGLINLNAGGKDSWLSGVWANLDALNNAWNQSVLNYTPAKQLNLLHSLGFADADWNTLILLMFVLGSAVTAATAFALLLNRKKVDPVVALYAALCREMARHGIVRAIHEGPRAYGARLAGVDSPLGPEKKAAVTRFLVLYEAVLYGAKNTLPKSVILAQLKTLFTECR